MAKKALLTAAVAMTIVVLTTWQATGGDWYTKYEVVEQVTINPDANDPLAAAGFFDDAGETMTVRRSEFHLGLLPTAAGLIDKHALSVTTSLIPLWVVVLASLWLGRRRSTNLLQPESTG